MFDFIKKLFGEGIIRADIVLDDGRTGTVKLPYIGDIDTLDPAEFKQEVANQCWVKNGQRVVKVTIVGNT
jgi:hypothetical protein